MRIRRKKNQERDENRRKDGAEFCFTKKYALDGTTEKKKFVLKFQKVRQG